MLRWLKNLFRREHQKPSEVKTWISPEDVEGDPMQKFIVSEAVNSGKMVMGTTEDDGKVKITYSDGMKKSGTVDESGYFREDV